MQLVFNFMAITSTWKALYTLFSDNITAEFQLFDQTRNLLLIDSVHVICHIDGVV